LSIYIDAAGRAVLFDTGGKDSPLLPHFVELGLDHSIIEAVVISHSDPEHTSGLPDVLRATALKPVVYVPAAAGEAISQRNPGATVVAVAKPTRVIPDAWLVGPIQVDIDGESVDEQALVLDRPDGLVVIVGCSHPGIADVVQQVKEVFGPRKIKLVAGGFHLRATSKTEIKEISLRLLQMGVKNLALSHCTGESALKIFRQEWGDRVVSFDLGDTIDF